jgi:transcriptional regulator with XRE-family HTH domain
VSFFSDALDSLMREKSFTQLALSRRASVHQGQLSQYLNGQGRPEMAGLERLCDAFGAEGVTLLVAYLRDEVPEKFRNEVEIRTRKKVPPAKESIAFAESLDQLPPRIRDLLEDAARACERRPELIAALESTIALTRER